jgi:hypothetical protein
MRRPSPGSWLLGAVFGIIAGAATMWHLHPVTTLAPVVSENPRELYDLAEKQIEAFRNDDFPMAYSYAASGIREKFPLLQFKEMVCQTYPHLAHSERLNFGKAQYIAQTRASAMIYVSHGSASTPMIYAFVKENGAWKIEGVQMLRGNLQTAPVGEPRT